MRSFLGMLALLSFAICGIAAAHDGGYVDSFGVQGREQIGFAPNLGVGLGRGGVTDADFVDIAIQPDGKFVIAATVDDGGANKFGVLRLNLNGTLDTNFGTQGQTIATFGNTGTDGDVASSVVLQPDGRIVVCGQASGDSSHGGDDFGIMRFTSSGALDTTFSADGMATVAFNLGSVGAQNDQAVRCLLQNDGKIVAVGIAQTDNLGARVAVARLNSDGSRDTTFNGTGTATIDFGPTFTVGFGLSAKTFSNGDLLIVGSLSNLDEDSAWAIARLTSSGALASTFGDDGIIVFDAPINGYQPIEAIDATVLSDDSFVVAGEVSLASSNVDWGIFKFTSDGALDSSYANDGDVIVPWDLGGSLFDTPVRMVQDVSGRLVIAGFGADATSYTLEVARLLPDGSLDPSFGISGKVIGESAPPPSSDQGDQGTTVALTPDGSLVVGSFAYSTSSPTGYEIGLAKLVGDTIFDGDFDPQ